MLQKPSAGHLGVSASADHKVAHPFLRWAGAKRRHLPQIRSRIPAAYGAYYEPFLGSGSLFFDLRPTHAHLGDKLAPLVQTWRTVASTPGPIADKIAEWNVDKETYYAIRGLSDDLDPVTAAARFIYLNKACFNGLYRVNQAGMFNVPFGRPKTSYVTDRESLQAVARALGSNVTIVASDFETTLQGIAAGDLAFLDPPYVTGHANNGFIEYNEHIFSWADQERLAATASRLADLGVHVVMTNADHAAVRDLYSSDRFDLTTMTSHSTMAGNASKRRLVSELLITSK